MLTAKLKTKAEGKAKIRRAVDDANKDAAYWEDRATKVEQEFAGEYVNQHTFNNINNHNTNNDTNM